MMKLTFDGAVAEHRKMWNWIADNIESFHITGTEMKEAYMQEFFPNKSIHCDCFCCEYVENFDEESCKYCPIVWRRNRCCSSEYGDFKNATIYKDYARASKIARTIANLPTRGKREGE